MELANESNLNHTEAVHQIIKQCNWQPIHLNKKLWLVLKLDCGKEKQNKCSLCPRHGTHDLIFILSRIFEGASEFAQPVFKCFMELKKAFDRVHRGIPTAVGVWRVSVLFIVFMEYLSVASAEGSSFWWPENISISFAHYLLVLCVFVAALSHSALL